MHAPHGEAADDQGAEVRTALLLLLALAGSAAADKDPGKRKTAPDRYIKAAGEAFAAATAADQKGDLPTALGLYQKAFAISPHPASVYNIADIQRRLGNMSDAVVSYETYLAISPDASDRKTVEAVIEKLNKAPSSIFIMTARLSDPKAIDLKTAYILLDGKIVVKPNTKMTTAVDAADNLGFELMVPPGKYKLEAVSPLTYGLSYCAVGPGERKVCAVSAPPRIDGNVVLSGNNGQLQILTKRPGNHRRDTEIYKRIQRPPGRDKLFVRDNNFECPALVLDVPRNGDVIYAFVKQLEPGSVERCRAMEITLHRLAFAP